MQQPESNRKHTIKRLGRLIRPYSFWLVLRIFGAVISAGVEIGIAFIMVSFADIAIKGNITRFQEGIPYAVGIVFVGIIFSYLNKYASGKLGVLVVQSIRNRAVEHILKLPASYTQERHSGETVSRLTNGLVQIQSFLENDLPNLIFQPVRFLAAFAYMLLISWKLLLFCMIVMPLVLVVTNILSKPIQRYAEQLQQALGEVNSAAQDSIGGIQMLKAFNLKKILFQKYAAAVDRGLDKSLAVEKRRSLMAPLNILSQFLPFVLCFLYGGYLSIRGQITAGSLLAFIQLMNYLVQPLAVIPGIMANFRGTAGTLEHLFELLDQPPEREGGQKTADLIQPPVEFAGVTFSYNGENHTLDNISQVFAAGRTTALVGPSGSGKSTFFKLVCGFYSPDQGQVKLYGRNLDEWSLPAARSLISLVSQDTYLFPGTIRENIAYGRDGAGWEEIVAAAKTANAHDFIQELPEGYDTLVGERGARLSGGQKQRIAIARAVLKNAPLLLLDEATSALDTQSEALVQEALERFMQGRTVLVIAHRLSTIRNADEVLVLEEGRITERGTHNSLMEKGGLYRQLYIKQLSSEEQSVRAEKGEGA